MKAAAALGEMPLEHLAKVSHPRLKLFISADIVGSTAYKQPCDLERGNPSEAIRWAQVIQKFYHDVPDYFFGKWDSLASLLRESETVAYDWASNRYIGDVEDGPRLWKTVGDEVIIWKTLTHEFQIWNMLACWLQVLPELRKELQSVAPGLDIKSTAWIAGFPVRNKAVWMGNEKLNVTLREDPSRPRTPVSEWINPSKDESRIGDLSFDSLVEALNKFYDGEGISGQVDFIGPGIDIGFRLGQWATTERFILSLDVAYLLSKTADQVASLDGGLKQKWFGPQGPPLLNVHFDGLEYLKGVLGGLNYPQFWINTLEKKSFEGRQRELNPHLASKPAKWSSISDFCEDFYDRRSSYIFRPFIDSPLSATKVPLGYERFFKEMAVFRRDRK